MKKFLILVLAIAMAFSIDCKDLMNSKHIICPIQKKTKQTVNHAEIDSDKKNQGNIPDISQIINGIPSDGAERNPIWKTKNKIKTVMKGLANAQTIPR